MEEAKNLKWDIVLVIGWERNKYGIFKNITLLVALVVGQSVIIKSS